jgi:membrane protease YdiL (CAAX protease family)
VKPRHATAVATVGVLAYAAVAPRLLRRHAALAAAGASAIAVGAARMSGRSWSDLGLEPRAARRGVRFGAAVAAPLALAVVAGARHPRTRTFFADARVTVLSNRDAAYELFVRIPVVTAATEELLFRSVFLAVASEDVGVGRATAWTSLVFGVWHVIPALHSHQHNAAAAGAVDGVGGRAALVAGTVAATAAAGLGLCALRLRSKSVVAPILVHAAINAAAFAMARATRDSTVLASERGSYTGVSDAKTVRAR